MPSYSGIPENAIANVQAFSRKTGVQRDCGHIAHNAAELISLVSAHHEDDRVHVHFDPEFRNAWTNEEQIREWRTCPDQFLAYYSFPAEDKTPGRQYRRAFRPLLHSNLGTIGREDIARVTTWPGSEIGTIVSAHVFGHNFGGRIVAIVVRGNNGAMYYGRASYDNGSCITLRKAKS